MVAVGACASGAANEATAYSGGGYDDWFLPSKDELNAMYTYMLVMTSGMLPTYGFENGNYWSSSQFDSTDARTQNFDNGEESPGLKVFEVRVRPIRAF